MSYIYSWFYPPNEEPIKCEPTALELKNAMERLKKIPIDKQRAKYLTPLAKEFQKRIDDGIYIPWDATLSKQSDIIYRLLQEKSAKEDTELPELIEHHKKNIPVLLALQGRTRLQ